MFGKDDARKFGTAEKVSKPASIVGTQRDQLVSDAYADPATKRFGGTPLDVRTFSPNINTSSTKGVKVAIDIPSNGHGVGVSFSNVNFGYA